MATASVSIVRVPATAPSRDDVLAAVRRAMELSGWQEFIPRGAEVALKPNLGWDLFLPGSVTSPWAVEGVVRTIRDWVGKIHVVESDQVVRPCFAMMDATVGLEGNSPKSGKPKVVNRMRQLGVGEADLIVGAYIDLMSAAAC